MSAPRRLLVGLVVLAVAVAATACSSDDVGPEQARLRVSGSATVSADGDERAVTGSETLAFGDVVTVTAGTATVELASGETYELRAAVGSDNGEGATATVMEIGAPPVLVAGDVLISAGFPAAVTYDISRVTALGPTRVRGSVPSVTSYAGETAIRGTGNLRSVPGLRTAVLARSAEPEAVTYDPADSWDRRFLGEAHAFGQRLEALARGYTSELGPGARPSAGFYRSILADLANQREFAADLLDDGRSPGEYLIGAAVAQSGQGGTFRGRWVEVFAFRDLGAEWGIVALDQGVSTAPLISAIEVAVGTPPPTEQPVATLPDPSAPVPPPPTTAAPSPTPPPTTVPPTTTVPDPEPDDPEGGVLGPILEPVGGLLEEILGILGLG